MTIHRSIHTFHLPQCAQVAVALAVYVNLVPLFFSSLGQLILLSPPLLAVMPLLAPVMAVWNAFNPDVPLVFWRWVGKCGSVEGALSLVRHA